MNLSDSCCVAVLAYNSQDKFLPYYGTVFGNNYQFLNLESSNATGLYQQYVLNMVHWKAKSQPTAKCAEREDMNTSLETCIERFIEQTAGCSSLTQRSSRSLPLCETIEQYHTWADLANKVTVATDENEVYNLTGCLPPCERVEYDLVAERELQEHAWTQTAGRSIAFKLYFKSGKYEVKEQFFVYDQNSFIADVGGYLGLLLGQSMFSIFCGLENVGSLKWFKSAGSK